jgi:hypothetical protein
MKNLLSEFHHRTEVIWGPETKLNTQNFEIQVPKGTPLVKGLRFCQGTVFMARKWFYRVQKVDLRFKKENCCQIYPRMNFLEQNLES